MPVSQTSIEEGKERKKEHVVVYSPHYICHAVTYITPIEPKCTICTTVPTVKQTILG